MDAPCNPVWMQQNQTRNKLHAHGGPGRVGFIYLSFQRTVMAGACDVFR